MHRRLDHLSDPEFTVAKRAERGWLHYRHARAVNDHDGRIRDIEWIPMPFKAALLVHMSRGMLFHKVEDFDTLLVLVLSPFGRARLRALFFGFWECCTKCRQTCAQCLTNHLMSSKILLW